MAGEGAKGTGILAGILMMAGIAVAIPVMCARRVLAAAAARRPEGLGVDMADGSAGGGKRKK
jgi:hypothetical protein